MVHFQSAPLSPSSPFPAHKKMESMNRRKASHGSAVNSEPGSTQQWNLTQPFVMEAVAELQKHPYSLETTTVQIMLSVSPPVPLRGGSGYFHSRRVQPRLIPFPDNEAQTIKRAQLSNVFLYVNGKLVDTARMKKDGRLSVDVVVGDQKIDLSGKVVELCIYAVSTTKLVEFGLDFDKFISLHNICIDVDGQKITQDTGYVNLNFSTEHPAIPIVNQ